MRRPASVTFVFPRSSEDRLRRGKMCTRPLPGLDDRGRCGRGTVADFDDLTEAFRTHEVNEPLRRGRSSRSIERVIRFVLVPVEIDAATGIPDRDHGVALQLGRAHQSDKPSEAHAGQQDDEDQGADAEAEVRARARGPAVRLGQSERGHTRLERSEADTGQAGADQVGDTTRRQDATYSRQSYCGYGRGASECR